MVGRWVCERTGGTYTEGTAIGLEKDGKLIAGVLYDHFNHASVQMHVAAEGHGWLDREYLWFCFYYPFEQLGVKIIIGLVAGDNFRARRFDEHLGFVLHTKIPEAHPTGDLCIYTMRKDQCRWLEKRNQHGQQKRSARST